MILRPAVNTHHHLAGTNRHVVQINAVHQGALTAYINLRHAKTPPGRTRPASTELLAIVSFQLNDLDEPWMKDTLVLTSYCTTLPALESETASSTRGANRILSRAGLLPFHLRTYNRI